MSHHDHFAARDTWDIKRITPPAHDFLGYPVRYDAVCTCGAVLVALRMAAADTRENWAIGPPPVPATPR